MTTGISQGHWESSGGDVWARRWRDTDRALADLSGPLMEVVTGLAPEGEFRALDVGCGAGTTSIALAKARPRSTIIACDISPALAAVAKERTSGFPGIRILAGDVEAVAPGHGPFDLVFSRHGVMFFPDPVRAFRILKRAAGPSATLAFSCFQDWELNPWASELASAAADRVLPSPGLDPGPFAFANEDHVRGILEASGWSRAEARAVRFRYVAGEGASAVDEALSLLSVLGPAARIIDAMPVGERSSALERMRGLLERYRDGEAVVFPAAAWIWSAIG